MREHWTLDPDVVFLNHGSFGACPRAVLQVQTEWRARLEREPVRFFIDTLPVALEQAREACARFVGARPEDFAFVASATAGVNAVLRSLELAPGDELLVTDHAYNACQNALAYVARRSGAVVRVARVALPLAEPSAVLEKILAEVGPRTRLALIDHVTSQTGIVFPIHEIVRALRERGVETLVDGAHAPGMLALELSRLDAAYYTGNFHKWTCAPKGAGMLVVREDRKGDLHPSVISHGYNSARARARFLEEFDWTGTGDPSAFLCVPEAIRYIASLVPGGWDEVRARNRALAVAARRVLEGSLQVTSLAPEGMLGSLASVRVPDVRPGEATSWDHDPLQRALFERHRIEVPVFAWPAPPTRLLRISAQLYNTLADYTRLAHALTEELAR
jgi:isopenicillin-N epimerase